MTSFEVDKLTDLAGLRIAPPAMCYVHEDGNYYFKYEVVPELVDTPFYSVIGDGWHNMDSPCPRMDRPIHIIHTQWLNGWNLDYYPDYIDITQGGQDQEYLEEVFGRHYGPPNEDYNTVIEDLKPGDYIFRKQTWSGVLSAAVAEGATEIPVAGLTEEIADKWISSRAIPLAGQEITGAYAGSTLLIEDETYGVTDHEPNIRSENGYECPLGSDCYDASRFDAIWKPCGLPTTRLILPIATSKGYSEGTTFTIVNYHWYVVSVEYLGSEPDSTNWDTPRFGEGHVRECFDFYHLAVGNVAARFEAMLHSIANEEAFDKIWLQKKVIPGDILHNQILKLWYQVLPKEGSEVAFAEIARTLTVFDKEEFELLETNFEFNNLFIINLSHRRQSWRRPLAIGFDEDGRIEYDTRIVKPAEVIYYEGAADV